MTQFEFYKSFQFVVEILLAEVIFVCRFRRRKFFWLRLCVSVAACFLVAWLFPAFENALYMSFMFLAIFSFTVLSVKFTFAQSWLTVAFCCIAGYTTQHFSYEIYNMTLELMGANSAGLGQYGGGEILFLSNPFLIAVYLCVYVAAYMLSWFVFGNKLGSKEDVHLKTTFIFVFAVFILIIDIVLNAVVVYYLENDNVLYTVIVGIYNILCCLTSLYLQFEVALKSQMQDALETVRRLWHEEKEQYAESKENIRMINMRCHDLKHQIHSLGDRERITPAAIAELEQRISIYDSVVKTGNDALDVILTEKSLLCNKNNVRFSCIVDGGQLSFMTEEDIYSLFGNIIDNAIEAVLKVAMNKRTISLHVKAVDNMLIVRESNYYAEVLRFENGIPQTTKEDTYYHGYGIQSIRYICDKYGGELNISADGEIFSISIVFCTDAGE